MLPEGEKNDLEWSYFSRPWSRGNKKKTAKYQVLVSGVTIVKGQPGQLTNKQERHMGKTN